MSPAKPVVLIVEDDASLRRIAEFNLAESGHEVHVAADGDEGLERFRALRPDLTIADLSMPGRDGMQLLGDIRRLEPAALVIMITAFATVDRAVEAMKRGAFDFVTKPFSWETLEVAIARALEHRRLAEENVRLRAELDRRYRPDNLVGTSSAMQEVFAMVRRVAPTSASVLILGESGTGKEVVARAIHAASERHQGPFVALNCGALPRDLIEAELFGHERGAFTGAQRARTGRFEQASGGTILLDEIAELPVELQVKLLRVLEERTVDRLGGSGPIEVDVRVLAATNADVRAALDDGRLREDLYFRLNVVTIQVPPLRDRPEDIAPLVDHCLRRAGGGGAGGVAITPRALALLRTHAWPGNVRELENAIERALILRRDPAAIDVDDLPLEIREPAVPGAAVTLPPEGVDIEAVERDLIRQALARTRGNQTRAARLLGMSRQTLLYRQKKHGLDVRGATAGGGQPERERAGDDPGRDGRQGQ